MNISAEESRALLEPLTGYTPRPWVVGDPSRMDEVEIGPDRWLHPGEGEYGRTPCAVVDICDDDPERIANCHLIAASPDLAAHLRAALDREAALNAERDAARAEADRLRDALAWYGEQSRLCRLAHSGGTAARLALAADGGKRARAALDRDVSE